MSDELKRKLAQVEDDLSNLRDDRAEKAKAREDAKAAFASTDGYSTDSDEYKAAQDAVRAVGEVDDKIAEAQAAQVGILKMLGQHDPAPNGRAPRGNGDTPNGESWSAAQMLADEQLRAALKHAAGSKSRFGGIDLGEIASRDGVRAAVSGDLAGTANMRQAAYAGVVPQVYRPLRVLDLLPTGTTDGNSVPYTKESGTFNAAETAEGSAKPQDGVVFTDDDAPVRTIAAWQKILKQALEDFAALQSIIEGRLRYSVLRRLEAQVLAGDGTGTNLTGILETTGINEVPYDSDVPTSELVLSALTEVYLSDSEANGIVLHPTDWQTALTEKTTGSGEYFSGGPFSVTPQVMWGVPLVPSPAIPQGTALVGDFAMGATLLFRTGVNVLISDSDQDDFIKNRVTILGEVRAALPVWRPAAFATVDLSAS